MISPLSLSNNVKFTLLERDQRIIIGLFEINLTLDRKRDFSAFGFRFKGVKRSTAKINKTSSIYYLNVLLYQVIAKGFNRDNIGTKLVQSDEFQGEGHFYLPIVWPLLIKLTALGD